jgi:hypothetical protein
MSASSRSSWRQRWLQGEPSYKDKLLRYNQDDCSALRRITEFIDTIICPGTPSSPTEGRFVHTSALSKDKDQGALFGKKEFVLEEFSQINECAYFDYQRDRVFARVREPHRRGNQKNARVHGGRNPHGRDDKGTAMARPIRCESGHPAEGIRIPHVRPPEVRSCWCQ